LGRRLKGKVFMELTIDQALQKAVEAHKAGQVQEADRLYTAILKAQPKHPDANHNLGLLAVSVGKVKEALPFLKTALEANPAKAQFWLSYIDTLIKLDRIEDAKAVLDQAKSKGAKGDGFDKLDKRMRGLTIGSYDNASKGQNPSKDQVQALIDLYNKGQLALVVERAQVLTKRYPEAFSIWNIMGASAAQISQLDLAIFAFKRAIELKPNHANAWYNMGKIFKDQGKLEEAVEAYKKTLTIKLDHAEAYYNMGNALQEQGKLEEAIEAYNKALVIKPDFAEAYNNMGNALQEQDNLDDAIEAYNNAIMTKPDYAEAYKNASELLKIYTPERDILEGVISIDNKIKKLSPGMLLATSNEEVVNIISEGLGCISDDSYEYKTPSSQIFNRNCVDLNCKRHMKIFNTKDIIPEFCFGCFKVQVEVATMIDLVKVTSIFYKFNFEQDLTKKTIIEMRPDISGSYKGLVYCIGLDQANAVKNALDIDLKIALGEMVVSKIKRGCSEYPLRFPNYGKISKESSDMMKFPEKWKLIENQFDQNELILPNLKNHKSLQEFCLSDFYIIQKWIDYAKGIDDPSIKAFNDRPILFKNIYDIAKDRVRKGKIFPFKT